MGFSLSDMFGGASNEAGAQTVNPGSAPTGGTSFSDLKNWLQGDPASAVAGLSALQKQAYAQGIAIKNFLMSQKGSSEAYYKPMQQMFGSMYGTGGIKPAAAPGVPGSMPIGAGGGGGGA